MKKLLAMLLVLVMTVCLPGTAAFADGAEKDLVIGIPATPEVLSPFVSPSTGRLHMIPVCYESLGYFTDSTYSEFKPQLMESYTVSDDYLTYTVKLHEDIYDTAGNHMTASDVVYSYDKGQELGGISWGRYVESYKALDDYTLEIKLLNPRATTFTDIARTAVVTQAAYEASEDEMATTPVSTSQYKLVSSVPGSIYEFERNEDYWNKDESTWLWRSNPDKVTYQVVLEESQMAINLETGAINVAVGMSNNSTDRYVGDSNYNMYELVGNMAYSVIFNNSENSVFHNNKELRQAVAYAIDADGIIEAVLGGAGRKLGTMGFVLAGDYDPAWEDDYYNYDEAKAKELLKAAGYEEGELEIDLVCSSGTIVQKTAEMVQLYLLAAGFKAVNIHSEDNALFTTEKNERDKWDIIIDTKGTQTTASAIGGLYDRNAASYGNPCFVDDDDTLQAYAEQIPLSGTTQEEIEEAVAYVNDMCYMYGLYNTSTYTVSSKNITSVLQDFRSAVIPGETEFAE